jgi:hypothetical protein
MQPIRADLTAFNFLIKTAWTPLIQVNVAVLKCPASGRQVRTPAI